MLAPAALQRAFSYVADHPEIWEVIVTGGDPFLLSPRRIVAIVRRLEAIPHVAVIRFHTRVPVADPRRVGDALVAALAAREGGLRRRPRQPSARIDAGDARGGRAARPCAAFPVLSQSVLLRGVNDDAAVLESLLRGLVAMRVKPYYLHHPDLAPGTAHFRLGIEEGQRIVGALRGAVSGLCQPSYVLDIPGGYGKVPIDAQRGRAGRAAGVVGRRGSRRRQAPLSSDCRRRRRGVSAQPMAAAEPTAVPTMIIVGGDALALGTAREICLHPRPSRGRAVARPTRNSPPRSRPSARSSSPAGRRVAPGSPRPGSSDAVSILALSGDDQLNLQAALRARDANPRIRIVLRQFNRTLAAKIEQNLPDCSVLSLAWHSAATYAAAALDPSCLRGLQFPEQRRPADRICRADRPITRRLPGRPSPAPRRRSARASSRSTATSISRREETIAPGARLIVYTAVDRLLDSTPRQLIAPRRPAWRARLQPRVARLLSAAATGRPLCRRVRAHRAGDLRGRNLAFPQFLRQRLADRGLFRAEHDDDDRVWRHHPQSQRPRGRRHRDGADAVGHGFHRDLHRLCRLAADPRAMGADAGSAPDPPARPYRRLRLRQHRDRGHRPPAWVSTSRSSWSSRPPTPPWSSARATRVSIS